MSDAVASIIEQAQITEDQFYGRAPIVGRSLCLSGFSTIPKGFNPVIRRDLFLNGLKRIPEGFNPVVGGSLYLSSVEKIPKWFNPVVGHSLMLHGVKTLSRGTNLAAGQSIWLSKITSVPEGVNFVFGRCLYLEGNAVGGGASTVSWRDGRYRVVDGILTEVLATRGNVSRVRVIGETEISYLVTDGTSFAHGKTVKEAKDSLRYKTSDRSTERFKSLTLDSVLTFKQAVELYRIVTGACAYGVQCFVQQKNLTKVRKIRVKKLLEITEGEYGSYKLQAFFLAGQQHG